MSPVEIRMHIKDYLARTFLVDFDTGANADTDLFEAGFIDSYGFIELVAFLEQAFEIRLSDDELASPEMSTLAGMGRLLEGRQGEPAARAMEARP